MHALSATVATVLLSAAALTLLVSMLAPRSRPTLATVTLAGLGGGAGAALVAALTGAAHARGTGVPALHAEYGRTLLVLAVALLVAAAAWYHVQRLASRPVAPYGRSVAPALEVITGIATIGLLFALLMMVAAAWFSGRTLGA